MKHLSLRNLLWLLVALLILLGAACGSPVTPQPSGEQPQPTELPGALPTQEPGDGIEQATPEAAQPAILEARRLTLEWPPRLRTGDSDLVRLTLEVDELGGITPTAVLEDHETRGETVYIPDVYATHNVIAEARLDLAGMEVSPATVIGQPLLPGQSVTFYWSVSSDDVGVYRGTVWLYLRFLPLDGSPASERPLSAQIIEIETVNLLGLSGAPARWLGGAGMLLGGMLGLEDLLKLGNKLRQLPAPPRKPASPA